MHNPKSKIKTIDVTKQIRAKAIVSNKSSVYIITYITAKLQHKITEKLPVFAYVKDTKIRERNKSVEKMYFRNTAIPDTCRITKTNG